MATYYGGPVIDSIVTLSGTRNSAGTTVVYTVPADKYLIINDATVSLAGNAGSASASIGRQGFGVGAGQGTTFYSNRSAVSGLENSSIYTSIMLDDGETVSITTTSDGDSSVDAIGILYVKP